MFGIRTIYFSHMDVEKYIKNKHLSEEFLWYTHAVRQSSVVRQCLHMPF